MTYQINGTEISIQPTEGRWIPRTEIGVDGNGRPIYSSVRSFELSWQLVDPATINQLQTFFEGVGATGTAVASLPQYGAATYTFYDYSGCVLQEPNWDAYFSQYVTELVLVVTKIRT